MVSGPGNLQVVTGVMKIFKMGKQNRSGSVCQDYADLMQGQLLLLAHYQKLEAAAQAVAITHHSSQLDEVRRERYGELQGDNFAGLQRAAQSCSDAILAELVGAAPAGGDEAFAKHRYLNARVETIAAETPRPLLRFGGRLPVIAQSRFTI